MMSGLVRLLMAGLVASSAVTVGISRQAQTELVQSDSGPPAMTHEGLRPMLEAAVVDGCLMCHRGALDLSERSVEELQGQIAGIVDGSLMHVVPLPVLSDEDRLALAQALAGMPLP